MTLAPILLGLLAALCLASSDLLSRGARKVQGPYTTAVHQLLLGTVLLVVIGIIVPQKIILTPGSVILMVAAGVLNFVAVALLYRGLSGGVVSIVAPIAYSYPAVTLVLSILLLGVSVSGLGIAALAGIIIGVFLASARLSDLLRKIDRSSVYPAVSSAVFSGLAFLALGAAAKSAGPFLPTLFLRGVGALSGFLLAPAAKQTVKVTRYVLSPRIFAVASLALVAFFSYNTAVSSDPNSLPIVAALSGIAGALEAAFGILFLRERLETIQIVGTLLLVVSVFALLLSTA